MGIGQNLIKGGAYDPIYQKLDNKAKIFDDQEISNRYEGSPDLQRT